MALHYHHSSMSYSIPTALLTFFIFVAIFPYAQHPLVELLHWYLAQSPGLRPLSSRSHTQWFALSSPVTPSSIGLDPCLPKSNDFLAGLEHQATSPSILVRDNLSAPPTLLPICSSLFSLRPSVTLEAVTNRNVLAPGFARYKVGDDARPAPGTRVNGVSCFSDLPVFAFCSINYHVFGPKTFPGSICARTPFHFAPSCPFDFTFCSGSLGLVLDKARLLFGRHIDLDVPIGTCTIHKTWSTGGFVLPTRMHHLFRLNPDQAGRFPSLLCTPVIAMLLGKVGPQHMTP